MPRETYRQVAGVLRGRNLLGVDQETEAREVFGRGKPLRRKRQFQCGKPVVMQAFYLGALGREVIRLAISRTPLILVVHLLHGHVVRQLGVDGVIEHHGEGNAQHRQYQE